MNSPLLERNCSLDPKTTCGSDDQLLITPHDADVVDKNPRKEPGTVRDEEHSGRLCSSFP